MPLGLTLSSEGALCITLGRVVTAFSVGVSIPLVVLLVGLPWLGSRGGLFGTPLFVPLSLLAAAAAAGGVVAGGSLYFGSRGRFALVVAYVVGLWPVLAVVGTLSALTGHETFGELGARFIPAFAASYFLIGCSGSALLGRGWRQTATDGGAGVAFGAIGGLVMTGTVSFVAANTALVQFVVAAVGGAAGCVVSSALGGWWLWRTWAE